VAGGDKVPLLLPGSVTVPEAERMSASLNTAPLQMPLERLQGSSLVSSTRRSAVSL
jgi:hypothetical protein